MNRPLLLLLLCVAVCASPDRALAQLDLAGAAEAVELAVNESPGERLLRELDLAEQDFDLRLQRQESRSRFFLERVDARRRELEERERALVQERAQLGRRAAPTRQRITQILGQMRALTQNLTRIEEEWLAHLDELAEGSNDAARLIVRLQSSRSDLGSATSSRSVAGRLERLAVLRTGVDERTQALELRRRDLERDIERHRGALDEARAVLQRADDELMEQLRVAPPAPAPGPGDDAPALGGPTGEGPAAGPGLGAGATPAATPSATPTATPPLVMRELSEAEQMTQRLDDESLRLSVRVLERYYELDRVRLSRVETALRRVSLEVPVLQWEEVEFSARLQQLRSREQGGLLGRSQGPLNLAAVSDAIDHGATLFKDPRETLDGVISRIRGGAHDRPRLGGRFIGVLALGLLALLLQVRLRARLLASPANSRAWALSRHALLAALPLLPVALVNLSIASLDAVAPALKPLFRFAGWAPPLVAAIVAMGMAMFPRGGTESMRPMVARYARSVLRFGAALACAILLVNALLPLLDFPSSVGQLVRGLGVGWVLLGWLLLMVRKKEILGAFGALGDDPGEGLIKAGVRRFFRVFALGPLAAYVLYASGYGNLARFLVQGGLVTLLVVLLAPVLHQTLRTEAAKVLGYPDGGGWLALGPEGAKAAYRGIAPLILIGVGGAAVVVIAAGWNSGKRLGDLGSILTRPLLDVGGSAISLLSLLLLAVTVFGTVIVSRQFVRLLNVHIYPLYDLDRGMRTTVDTLSRYVVLVLGVVVGLDVVGVGMGFLTVFAGVIGIGVGFGSQTLASNFIAGLILLFARPVAVDDVIEVGGITGRVVRISAYATIVRTLENLAVVVPNADLVSGAVVNWSVDDPKVRLSVLVGVAYGSDVALVRRLLLEAAVADPRVLSKPTPIVRFDDFGDSALLFNLMPWTDDPDNRFQIASNIRMTIDKLFRDHGVLIPFPQRDLHLRSGDATLKVALERGYEVRGEDGEVLAEAGLPKGGSKS